MGCVAYPAQPQPASSLARRPRHERAQDQGGGPAGRELPAARSQVAAIVSTVVMRQCCSVAESGVELIVGG
jgi:hypothetical protein